MKLTKYVACFALAFLAPLLSHAYTSYVPNCLGGFGMFAWGYISQGVSTSIYVSGQPNGYYESSSIMSCFYWAYDNAAAIGGNYAAGDGYWLY